MRQYNNLNQLNYLFLLLISPSIKLGDVKYNTDIIIDVIKQHSNTNLFVFPELSLTGASLSDYFFSNELPSLVWGSIQRIIEISYDTHTTIIFGSPLKIDGKLINCGLFIADGKLLGVIPKNTKSR